MADLSNLVPAKTNGWEKQDQQSYNPENLHEYINGGAELYISYGFKEMLSCRFEKKDQSDIFIDIFDMGNSSNAYGIFAHFRETTDSTFGQGSQYMSGNLLFWKDHYFVSILASPENEQSKQTVFSLAKHIEQQISETGAIPEIISLFPQQNLIQESIRYFKHYIWLNSYYFIADKNILNIDQNTEAALAKYESQEKQSILLLVNYQSENDANNAVAQFTDQYAPELKEKFIIQIEDGTWLGYQIDGRLVSIVFNASSVDNAKKLLALVGKQVVNEEE